MRRTFEVHNHTRWPLERITAGQKWLGCTVNNWRGRFIDLYEHPEDPGRLISVGVTFDGLMTVVSDDDRGAWVEALDRAARGGVYVSD